ncbi:MAG: c-type cytochrome [Verrucomicrobiaceae bacterium]|nr:c-type cytochrome [Verrucomicrobiaceae bacterium]
MRLFLFALCPLLSAFAAEPKDRLIRETPALTPEAERAALHAPEGFEVQLFAAEPQINKPINLAFDAKGRLWVSSTVEYPYAAEKSRWSDPQGTRVQDSRDAIKILEDTDGDGRADKITVFADALNIPTGVLPWHKPEHKSGCIAFSIPNIWYFADTDGDDHADLREVLFGPLGYEKDTHGMCSSFRLGLDGWVYATHGFNNTSNFKAKDGSTLELQSGNVFRFKPDGSRVEKYTRGQVNPFGLAWDRYGNLYSADCHSSPVYQLIRGACYPSFGKPHDGLGFAPVMCQHTHGSTGICGIVYLDGGVWGPEWDDHILLGNCVTSRVNHDHVTFTGSTPKANEQPDFITSDDPWFRPVDLQLGPDNALYIADFYNKIIGHYEVPLDHKGRDKTRGRIWRVVNKKHSESLRDSPVAASPLNALHSSNLTRRYLATELLIRQNNPAHDAEAPASEESVAHSLWIGARLGTIDTNQIKTAMDSFPLAKTHALRLACRFTDQAGIPGYSALTRFIGDFGSPVNRGGATMSFSSVDELIRRSPPDLLARQEAEDQKASIECIGASEGRSGIYDLLLELRSRSSLRDETLRLTTKIALKTILSSSGSFKALPPDATEAVEVALAVPNAESSHWLWRVETQLPTRSASFAKILTHIARHGDPTLLPQAIALARRSTVPSVASVSSVPSATLPLLTALHDGLSERGTPPLPELLTWAQDLAKQLLEAASQKPAPAWTSIGNVKWSLQPRKLAEGGEVTVLQSMAKGGGDEESRTGTLQSKIFDAPAKLTLWLNGHRGFPTAKPHDKNLVRIVEAQTGQTLASAFPPRHNEGRRTEFDLSKHTGKRVRLEIIDGDNAKAYAWLGITRIEPAVVSVNDFQSYDTTRESLKTLAVMLQHSAPAALREKLATYLPPRPAPPPLPVSPEQRRQLDTLIAARAAAYAKAKPDLEVGANVFKMNCAACHQIQGEGGLIGPQLDGIGTRGPERLCEDILDPNRNVDAHFHLHTFTLKDGTVTSGFLKAELGEIKILADATGKEHRLSKKDITKSEVTPMSLMPPTFGQTMDEATFSDLLGYLLGEQTAAAPLKPHPQALANTHPPGEVDRPEMVRFIVNDPAKLAGIVVDETKAQLTGEWQYSTHTPPYVGLGYLHDMKAGKGLKAVTFTPELPKAGWYEVRLAHCYNVRRATNTPVTIHHADGDTTLRINQQEEPPHDRLFRTLGTFRFEKGRAGWVRISNEGTDPTKVVIADAVQFIPVEKK